MIRVINACIFRLNAKQIKNNLVPLSSVSLTSQVLFFLQTPGRNATETNVIGTANQGASCQPLRKKGFIPGVLQTITKEKSDNTDPLENPFI